MHQVAQNVLDGRFTAAWAALAGVYMSVDLLRANPAAADVAGLQRTVDAAHAALSRLTLRALPFTKTH